MFCATVLQMIPLSQMCPERTTLLQLYYGFFAMVLLVNTGMNLGFSSIALPLLTRDDKSAILYHQEAAATWFASIISIAVPIGCCCSIFTMRAGRRKAVLAAGVVFFAGWTIIATSYKIPQLLVGRFITGFAMGLASTPAPVYVAEIALPAYKTTLTAWVNVFICLGIMLIYLLGAVIPNSCQIIAAVTTIVPAFTIISAVFFMPESPRWLLLNGQELEARKSLLRIRGLKIETDEFNEEFKAMVLYHAPSQPDDILIVKNSPESSCLCSRIVGRVGDLWETAKRPEVWKPFVILNLYFFFQQFCGIYVIIGYSVDLVIDSGITVDPFLIAVLIGVVQILAGLVLVICSSRVGRRPLSIISGVGMTISLVALAVYVHLKGLNIIEGNYSAIPIASILIFVATGSFGFQALPWAMIGELYPTKYVNVLGPMTTCIEGIFSFASLQLYPVLVGLDFTGTIYFFAFISLVATVFIISSLPETHGRTHEQIEDLYKKGR